MLNILCLSGLIFVTNKAEEKQSTENAWYLCGGPCQKCINHAQFILHSVSLYSIVSFPDHIICGLELDYLLVVSYRALERLKLLNSNFTADVNVIADK